MRKRIISGIFACTVAASGAVCATTANAQATAAESEASTTESSRQESSTSELESLGSSEFIHNQADQLEPGSAQDALQGFADGSTVPESFNPIDLARRELEGSSMMSSGSSTGDVALSARGMGQALSTLGTVFLAVTLLGQAVEWIMRGLRIVRR